MTNKIEWKIAAALANAEGLDWGRWALGLTARCCPYCAWTDPPPPPICAWCGAPLVPVADPSDVEAYKADCARRGVEPGPLPSLRGDGWAVRADPGAFVKVLPVAGIGPLTVWSDGRIASELRNRWGSSFTAEERPWEHWLRLARVVVEAMR